jgi:hypothetical protein
VRPESTDLSNSDRNGDRIVTPLTFASSRSRRWAQLVARACGVVTCAVILGWGARRGIYGLLVAATLLIAPILWLVSRPGWRAARRVVVSDEYLEGTGYGGTRIRLTWDGVGEVQHFVRTSTRGPIRVLRLASIDRQREVIFDDRLPGFEQLMGLVETRIRHVPRGTPSSWGRMLWPTSQVGRDGVGSQRPDWLR